MAEQLADLIEEQLRLPREQTLLNIRRGLVALAGLGFILFSTVIVAFDSVFVGVGATSTLEVGSVAPRDILAPPNATSFISQVLTDERREAARQEVDPIYFPPDPEVARQQQQLAGQISDYVDDIRNDPYASIDQRIADIRAVTALDLNDEMIRRILQFDTDSWDSVQDGVINVLSNVMQQEITPESLQRTRLQISNRVGARYPLSQSEAIVAVVEDLVQPNTFINEEATRTARQEAADAVEAQERSYISGQIVVREGEQITPRVYEALQALNLLQSEDLRAQTIGRSFVASVLVVVVMGLYLVRFAPETLDRRSRMLTLLATIFLIMLTAVRFLGVDGNIYLFPSAALALVYVTISGPHVAIPAVLGFALLTGMMSGDSLKITAMIASSGLIGTLVLRRAERLNSFFVAGAMIALGGVAVVLAFNLATPTVAVSEMDFATQMILVFFSGVLLAPATAIAVMYGVTLGFNLPTALKLIDLSQPSKPLLQRLLREAPGTYQHSLQVANLSEQAANSIGADAQLTHVAALYHDIGKMLNPLYFTENQQDMGNPHDTLNDPYRSADIIIGHVIEGDELARQYRLPNRIRDFIREHHGTTQVYVFYRRAVNAAGGDESAVDISDFSYPGPRPQSRETAILMMADSCEAAVRSVKPESKQEISDLVGKIIDDKRRTGQLDDSDLTLNEIREIQTIFVELLQGMFHPRINYREAVEQKNEPTTAKAKASDTKPEASPDAPTPPRVNSVTADANAPESSDDQKEATKPRPPRSTGTDQKPVKPMSPAARAAAADSPPRTPPDDAEPDEAEIADEEPMTEVPRLPTMDERRATGSHPGVTDDDAPDESDDSEDSPS